MVTGWTVTAWINRRMFCARCALRTCLRADAAHCLSAMRLLRAALAMRARCTASSFFFSCLNIDNHQRQSAWRFVYSIGMAWRRGGGMKRRTMLYTC